MALDQSHSCQSEQQHQPERTAAQAAGRVYRRGRVRIQPGDLLPPVTLHSTGDRDVDLAAEAAVRHVIIFFYPGDREGMRYPELAGCTDEARSFRDHLPTVHGLGTVVFGVSLQSPERQRRFVERELLNIELLSDEQKMLVNALGIPLWVSQAGEEFVARTTVVVAQGRRVAAVFEDVEVDGHVKAVIEVVRRL